MKREDEAEQSNLEEFFSALGDKERYCFPDCQNSESLIENEEAITYDKALDTEEEIPLLYHQPYNGHSTTEEYKPETFKYYDQILSDGAFEKNIPAIMYALKHDDIASEYVDIYKQALSNYAGDINE